MSTSRDGSQLAPVRSKPINRTWHNGGLEAFQSRWDPLTVELMRKRGSCDASVDGGDPEGLSRFPRLSLRSTTQSETSSHSDDANSGSTDVVQGSKRDRSFTNASTLSGSTPTTPSSSSRRVQAWTKFKTRFKRSSGPDLQHDLFSLLHGGRMYHAPLKFPQTRRVLDIGTGKGRWAVDFANDHPSCQVTGIDLEAFETWDLVDSFSAADESLLPNLTFATKPEASWSFDETFDYVHARYISNMADHRSILRSTFDSLSSGGWAEFHQFIGEFKACHPFTKGRGDGMERWNKATREGARRQGVDMASARKIKPLLERIGFQHIVQIEYEVPMNTWVPDPEMKRLGDVASRFLLQYIVPLTRSTVGVGLGWDTQQIETLIEDLRRDLLNTNVKTYLSIVTTFCQKPDPEFVEEEGCYGTYVDSDGEEHPRTYNPAAHIPIWCAG